MKFSKLNKQSNSETPPAKENQQILNSKIKLQSTKKKSQKALQTLNHQKFKNPSKTSARNSNSFFTEHYREEENKKNLDSWPLKTSAHLPKKLQS